MANYQQLQRQFVQALVGGGGDRRVLAAAATAGDAPGAAMSPALLGLLDALPYYGDPDWETAHRGALANLLATNLPNNGISPQGNDSGFGYFTSYSYNGPYSGYRDAFFHGVGQTGPAATVASQVAAVNGALNGGWWGNYAVAALTDAVRLVLSFNLDTSKLSGDLTNYHKAFLPALTASAVGVYQNGFAPTVRALATVASNGGAAAACSSLTAALTRKQWNANVNQSIAMGGDSTNAAVWFLYTMWITLKALGATNIDALIQQLVAGGLTVPAQVGPGSWWNGGYSSYFVPLSGSDVKAQAQPIITAGLPEQESTMFSGSYFPANRNVAPGNGYSNSLCYWGSLNWYNPPSSSCFGRGTGVLMADGQVKPIERVEVGDVVRSSLGPKKVVLVERPRRTGRALYRIGKLNVLVTSGHPFRSADASGPARLAVDPWALLDLAPTMAGDGVGALAAGTRLAAIDLHGPREVAGSDVSQVPGNGDADEVVHDLVLESWEDGHPSHYVGGPEVFVAVDTETADPLYDLPSAMAVAAAMEAALPACRAQVKDPVHELSARVAGLTLHEAARPAIRAAWPQTQEKAARPAVPGPSFYSKDGQWCAHASMLEAHLVRHHGRALRREIATAWRARPGRPAAGDHLALRLHDVELLGDAAIPAGATAEIVLSVRAPFLAEDLVEVLPVPASDRRRWHLVLDRVVDFERLRFDARAVTTLFELRINGRPIGGSRAIVEPANGSMAEEHFLFGDGGQVIGRVAVEPCWISRRERANEEALAGAWDRQRTWAMAIELGRRLGRELAAAVER